MTSGLKVHFDLLKKEHQALAAKYTELLRSTASGENQHGLAVQLVNLVSGLSKKDFFLSDIVLNVAEKQYKSHRFLLHARSSYWEEIESRSFIDIPDVSPHIFDIVFNWLYTDVVSPTISDSDLLLVAEQACKYKLRGLQEICELWLSSRLDVSNCVSVFEFAENYNLSTLRDQCSTLVGSRWSEFTVDHFSALSATLLYRLLKGHSENVLSSIIQLTREDVLFLFFIDNDSELSSLLNNVDSEMCALEEALIQGSMGIATQLIQHQADANLIYSTGDKSSILMRMLRRGNLDAVKFLHEKGANLHGIQDSTQQFTVLQQSCILPLSAEMILWQNEVLISQSDDLDFVSGSRDGVAKSALTLACLNPSESATLTVENLLKAGADPNCVDSEGKTPLYHVLLSLKRLRLAEVLVKGGADVNCSIDSEPLLHAVCPDAEAFSFVLKHSPNVNATNSEGSPVLHRFISEFKEEEGSEEQTAILQAIVALCKAGASVSALDGHYRTAVHLAVEKGEKAVSTLAPFLKDFPWETKDGSGNTPLQLALKSKALDSAQILIDAGAPVNGNALIGESLLLDTLKERDDETAVFLLRNKANYKIRDCCGRSPLELALVAGLSDTIRMLCASGVNLNERSDSGSGFPVLEKALSAGHIDSASLLASFGCDLESWTACEDGEQTLLHYMMDQGNQNAAIFLIQNGADVNACKKFNNVSDDDGQTPIHMAVGWGLEKVVAALVEKGANLNVQDKDGRTACHVAVREGNRDALTILLGAKDVEFIGTRDRLGQTPLSLAISRRDHKSAAEMVHRQPHAALQTNGNGENLLHVAVRSNDLESVLFLLGTHTDPTRTTQDPLRRTALHMSANIDDELIMRNLILAGCIVNARSSDGSTAMHEAIRARRANLVAILLENSASTEIIDERGECALLCAVRAGSAACVRELLSHNCRSGTVVNKIEQTSLHLCAYLSTEKLEKGTTAAEICEQLLIHEEERMNEKEFAAFVDAKDKNGNTAFLAAFTQGNAGVCRSLLKRGAIMAAKNSEGVSVFTYPTPTKQLLFGLLDTLEREPRWSEGDFCDCGAKFSITQRKHHCRHCGRVVCAPCSSVSMPIVKFGEEKKVRVCSMCSIVLTEGTSRL